MNLEEYIKSLGKSPVTCKYTYLNNASGICLGNIQLNLMIPEKEIKTTSTMFTT